MDTVMAILLTQIPIALAILVLAYEVYSTKKALMKLLERLVEKAK